MAVEAGQKRRNRPRVSVSTPLMRAKQKKLTVPWINPENAKHISKMNRQRGDCIFIIVINNISEGSASLILFIAIIFQKVLSFPTEIGRETHESCPRFLARTTYGFSYVIT